MIKRIKPVTRTHKIEGEIQRLVSEVLSERREFLGLEEGWVLPLDVSETDVEIVIKAEAPGMAVGDLLISLHSSRLEIRGVKREDAPLGPAKFLRLEREYGAFRRTISLPAAVQPDAARASLENGVLTIVLEKMRTGKARDKVVKIGRGKDPIGGTHG